MKSFKEFYESTIKEVSFAFGRFNPPTFIGHGKLINKVASLGTDYRIYPSHQQDSKKNPLSAEQKVKYMRAMFPQHARNIIFDRKIRTAVDALVALYHEGYTVVNMVVGADRMKDFEFLRKYNGVKSNHGLYDFQAIHFISAGERDPDSDDLSMAMSASKLRKAAYEGDFKAFMLGMSSNFKEAGALFNDVRQGMGLKPITNFREHIRLKKVSDLRERFIKGEIFNKNDKAISPTNEIITIASRGPNFVTDTNDNKYFVTDLKIYEEGGAGLEGTKEVVNNYLKGVPHSKIEEHPFFKSEVNNEKKSVIRKMD